MRSVWRPRRSPGLQSAGDRCTDSLDITLVEVDGEGKAEQVWSEPLRHGKWVSNTAAVARVCV